MRKALIPLSILMIILGLVIEFKEEILKEINDFLYPKEEIVLGEVNQYHRKYDFNYVKNVNDFVPKNKQDLINIYYTAINAGKDHFYFYCPEEYKECIKHVKEIAYDRTLLSDINNFVHPFNGFTHIETNYDSFGEVNIEIMKNYTQEEIDIIKQKVSEIKPQIINDTLSLEQNIKNAHDYIINNSKYDIGRSEYNIKLYKSDTAYGPLIEGYGICGGYTDAMQLFLEELGVKNYKISSSTHVWNAVFINNNWYHLDLTWDDPITTSKSDVLSYDFFLIPTEKLLQIEQTEHNFDQNVYDELKKAY